MKKNFENHITELSLFKVELIFKLKVTTQHQKSTTRLVSFHIGRRQSHLWVIINQLN
jgi:hypothetical protein